MTAYVEKFGDVQLVEDDRVAYWLGRGWVLDPNPLGSPDVPRPSLNDAIKTLKVKSDGTGYELGVALVRRDIPIAFDTPGLHDGVDLFTPQAGELFVNVWVTLETVWDGPTDNTTYVGAMVGFAGNPDLDPTASPTATVDDVNGAIPSAADAHGYLSHLSIGRTGIVAASAAYQLRVMLLDSNDNTDLGDPGSTQGALTVHVISVPPS